MKDYYIALIELAEVRSKAIALLEADTDEEFEAIRALKRAINISLKD